MTSRVLTIVISAGLTGLAIAPVVAQPDGGRLAQRAGEPSPDELRTFLERRLDATRESEATLSAMVARLDAGESPEVVARDAREWMREAMAPFREFAGGSRGDRRPGGAEPTVEELLDLLAEVDAPMRERLRRLAQEDPERARMIMRRAAPNLRELAQLKRDDPDAFRLRLAMMQAGRDAWRAAAQRQRAEREGAADDELRRRRDEIATAVRRRLELEQQLKAREIERLADRVGSLRASLDENSGRLDDLVDEQTNRMIERAAEPRSESRGGDGRRR